MKLLCSLFLLVFISACVTQQISDDSSHQTTSENPTTGESQTTQESQTKKETSTDLLGTTLTVPDTNTQIVVDEALLAGTLTDLQSQPKGTIKLSATQLLYVADRPYLVLPATVSLVTGGGGVYLFLLEQQATGFVQIQAINLGTKIDLLTLEQSGDTIVSTTVDPRTGKPPFTNSSEITLPNAPKPGRKVFELHDGQLLELHP
jgi:hypothetical protein